MSAAESMDLSESPLEIRRSFHWGVLVAHDASSTEMPSSVGATGIEATDTALAIRVRHAQDVDLSGDPFVVSVVLGLGTAPSQPTVECVMDIPSGTVEIGDADRSDRFHLTSGLWTVAVQLLPFDHPEAVALWFSPSP